MPENMGYPFWGTSNEKQPAERQDDSLCEFTGKPHNWVQKDDGRGRECLDCLLQEELALEGSEGSPGIQAPPPDWNPPLGSDYSGQPLSSEQRRFQRRMEKFQLHLDPEKQKTEMQRFAEDILRRICQGDPRGLEGRIQTLSEAIKAKKKWKGSTQTDFPYLPKGRERPFNSIVAAFTVDLYLLEGAEMNRIGIARTLRKADDVLAGMGMSDLLVPGKGNSRNRLKGYLSRDYRNLRRLLSTTGSRRERDRTWPNFLDNLHGMARKLPEGSLPSDWDDMTNWLSSQDDERMASLLPAAEKSRGKVSFEILYSSSDLSRDDLIGHIGWEGGRTDARGIRDPAARILGLWKRASD